MASALSPSPSSPSEEVQRKDEEQSQEMMQQQGHEGKEFMYKTKTIQFLGRTTPVILQNDNGPCPLLAICNVLLLKNNLNLNSESSEVSQERLLSLVAERLIDTNSNVDNKDAAYIENQQQNIADAIDRLPCLATGIDVNIKFRRIDDFEFTPECAIFDLLDIPLYHGWIADPQDTETANAIGAKSYNALVGELVGLEAQNVGVRRAHHPGEDSIDFAAATTAALGVPSPCLSKSRSLEDSPAAVAEHRKLRKGDLEEEAELLKALKLSENELPASVNDSPVATANRESVFACSDENQSSEENVPLDSQDTVKEGHGSSESKDLYQPETSILDDHKALIDDDSEQTCTKINAGKKASPTCTTTKADGGTNYNQSSSRESGEQTTCDDDCKKSGKQSFLDEKTILGTLSVEKTGPKLALVDNSVGILAKVDDEKVDNQLAPTITVPETAEKICGGDTVEVSGSTRHTADSLSSGRSQHVASVASASRIDGDEPIYEGEERISSETSVCEDKEPVYEGETILAEETDKDAVDPSAARATDGFTPEQGELIRNFLKSSASQLTVYGLFCLQDGLKERELCVFFRNNHFSTMFKYEGELYLLATDQGYLNQPDLVWEKLNEVNGDTLFMTGSFKEFKVDLNANGTWDENNAVTSTADYLASINSASDAGLDINTDLQLAIALQQQEFEQQPPRNNTQPPSSAGASRLVTGPQGPRSSARPSAPSSSKPEAKSSKDKCTVM